MKYFKYPRTYHFPDSPGLQNDDRIHEDPSFFEGKQVVATIKMDGENTSIYSDGHSHARSMDSVTHPSREWIRQLAGKISYQLPEGWRLCGENLYAKHSIYYTHITSYFYMFSIYDAANISLSWEDVVTWAGMLNLNMVPTFYKGVYDREKIHSAYEDWVSKSKDEVEGYVVRIQEKFPCESTSRALIKYVRAKHVQTDKNWMYQEIVPNKIIKIT